MNINKECQREVEILTGKLDKAETFHHQKLQEFMELLEQRTRQMSLLETTLETIRLPYNPVNPPQNEPEPAIKNNDDKPVGRINKPDTKTGSGEGEK